MLTLFDRSEIKFISIIGISGGSISNLYAFLAARHKMFPNYKEKGIATIQGQLVMFTSDQVSYSNLLSVILGFIFLSFRVIIQLSRVPQFVV